ncbi:MAG: hypothetical protein HY540_05620 [Deltaproteobacteria bacterium]|nr:hypothetical protein [Deltaproteobacteria bacterium]
MSIFSIGMRTSAIQLQSMGSKMPYIWQTPDEIGFAVHFWDARPQTTLVAVGTTQGYSLVNKTTQHLVRLDYNPQLAVQDTLFGALFHVSDTAEQFRHRFEQLQGPADFAALYDGLESKRGETNVSDLLLERYRAFQHRTDDMGLSAIQKMFDSDIHDSRYYDWLDDPTQYATIRDLYRRGAVTFLQVNLFKEYDMSLAADYLHSNSHRISTFVLSDPIDLAGGPDPNMENHRTEIAIKTLQLGLSIFPWEEDAVMQWTSVGGVPLFRTDPKGNSISPNGKAYYLDKSALVLPSYAYVEMSAAAFIGMFSDIEPANLPREYNFRRFTDMVDSAGVFIDHKLYVMPTGSSSQATRFEPPRRLAYYVRKGWQRWAEGFIRKTFETSGDQGLLKLASETDAWLTPRERGNLRKIINGMELRTGHLLLPEDRVFDPRPLEVRRQIQQPWKWSDDRFPDLFARRRAAMASNDSLT